MSKAKIYYYDIGDYLNREEKLNIIKDFRSIKNIPWKTLKPNEEGDWINQRNEKFEEFIPMAPEKKFDVSTKTFFNVNAIGISTNRDAWVYGFSKQEVTTNINRMIDFFNEQSKLFKEEKKRRPELDVNKFIDTNTQKISWTVNLKKDIEKTIDHSFDKDKFVIGVYRPFSKQHLYFDRPFIERPGLNSYLFPTVKSENLIISITGRGASKEFTSFITDSLTNLDFVEKNQSFPLYYYEENTSQQGSLFDGDGEEKYIRRDGISDFIHERAKAQYGKSVTKEDIFYYVYGLLHSEDYRKTFENDLKKMLPRLPLLDRVKDFWAFSNAGRELAELHLNYENHVILQGVEVEGAEQLSFLDEEPADTQKFIVDKIRFGKARKEIDGKMRTVDDQSIIQYNAGIKITNIPEKAYRYVVNGKSAIEWILDRYQVKTDKKSGITNDPNDWAREHGKPRYILDLLLSVITLSVRTVDIVEALPAIDFEQE